MLYVGLTRAAERLIITGVAPSRGEVVDDSWHSRTADRARPRSAGSPTIGPWGEGLSWRGAQSDARAARSAPGAGRSLRSRSPTGRGARRPQEERPPRPLSPSAIGPDREALPPPSPELRAAAERGTLLHSLFERLPAVAAADRRAAALRLARARRGRRRRARRARSSTPRLA